MNFVFYPQEGLPFKFISPFAKNSKKNIKIQQERKRRKKTRRKFEFEGKAMRRNLLAKNPDFSDPGFIS